MKQEFKQEIDAFFANQLVEGNKNKKLSLTDKDGYKFSIKIKKTLKRPKLEVAEYNELVLEIPYPLPAYYYDNLEMINDTFAAAKANNLPYPKTRMEKVVYNANNSFGRRSMVDGNQMFKIDPKKVIAVAKVSGEFYNHETDEYTMIKEGILVKYLGHDPKFVSNDAQYGTPEHQSGFTIPEDQEEKECLFFEYYSDHIFGYNTIFTDDMYLDASSFNEIEGSFRADRIDDMVGNHVDIYGITMQYTHHKAN